MTGMDLTAVIDTAARAEWDAAGLGDWETASQWVKQVYIDGAHRQVEAAFPLIAASVWDDGYDSGYDDCNTWERLSVTHPRTLNPYE